MANPGTGAAAKGGDIDSKVIIFPGRTWLDYRKGRNGLKIQKGMVLGLVAALLAGGATAVAETGLGSIRENGDASPVSVPVGALGDHIAFTTYERQTAGADWEQRSQVDYQILGIGRELDRTALEHDVVLVASNTSLKTDGGILGRENANDDTQVVVQAIDLITRDVIRIQQQFEWSRQAFFVVQPTDSGTQYTYGPDEAPKALFGSDVFVKQPLMIWQGHTFVPGESVPALPAALLAPEALKIHWDVGAVDLSNLDARAWVSETGFVGERRAVAVTLEGCVDLVAPYPEYAWWYTDEPRVEFLGFATPVPSRPCFAIKHWVSADVAYPVLIETRSTFGGVAHESLRTLAGLEAGSAPIPWSSNSDAVEYRPSNPDAERSPPGQFHPADGQGSRLSYPLSVALSAIERDLTLVRFNAWKAQHPGVRLVGANMVPTGPQYEGRQWMLAFGRPDLDVAYVVETERASSAAPSIQSESGEISLPPFFIAPAEPPITWAAAERIWAETFSPPSRDLVPNHVAWGFAYHDDIVYCPNAEEGCDVWEAGIYGGTSANYMSLFYTTDNAKQYAMVGPERLSDSALYLDALAGNIWLSRDGKRDVRVDPLAVTGQDDAREARALRVPKAAIPNLAHAAAASASVLGLFLIAYFLPLLKWTAAAMHVALPGYAKLHKADVLNNKVRETMVQAIRADPGVTPPQLQELTGAGWSTVVYHLGVLEKNKLVSSIIDGRHKRFFPIDEVNWSDRGRIAVLKNQQSRALYELILQEPGVGPSDLSHRFGVSRSTVYWHVERLENAGLVGRDRQRLKTAFFANPPQSGTPYDPKAAVEVS